jgi:ribonuclease-3
MEFLGDSILGFLITDFIFHEFPDYSEGRKSKIKAYLVSSTTLSMLALQLEIPKYLRLGKGEEKTGGRKKKALSANAFEAVIAAIYLDSGIEEVRRFLAPIFHPLIREVGDGRAAVEDPKTALQEYLQARNLESAQYSVTAETGPEHRKTFHVELRVGTRTLGSATGPTKKNAELLAAQSALAKLLQEDDAKPGT